MEKQFETALAQKDAEIERLKSEIIRFRADAKRWRLLVDRYPDEPSSHPLIDELMEEPE